MEENSIKCPHCGLDATVEKTNFYESHICEHCLQYAKIIELPSCCSKSNYQLVKYITSSQTIQVREQCTYCGNIKGNSVGGVKPEQKEKLPVADVDKRERRVAYISNAWKVLSNKKSEIQKKKNEENKKEWFEKYTDYLNSPEWKAKRLLVLQRDKYLCQSCLLSKAIQVHHKSYEFCDLKGSEPCFDLTSVCLECHEKIEAKKKENRLLNSKI